MGYVSTRKMDCIVLASQSPRRREILDRLAIPYLVYSSNVEEEIVKKRSIRFSVIDISRKKVDAATVSFSNGLVLGIDTIVYFHRKVLCKPKNKDEAYKFLKMLSGNRHRVISGITVKDVKSDTGYSSCSVTEVYFANMTQNEIEQYLNQGEWTDKAGGYAIQGRAALWVEKIVGSYYNVMGLPVEELYRLLKEFSYFESNGTYRPIRK